MPDSNTTQTARTVHPNNTLNELAGDEWLYFTQSLLTTAYPSELGHAARKAHGANKPPRLMARLIWYQAGTRLRSHGYPHALVPNIVHQHVLVLRAE
ncbi:MAG: hypothetical protein U9O18_05760 [Chloroflexota bacterium]|nr:hypothetical protein [Chloroflexota bacterium]